MKLIFYFSLVIILVLNTTVLFSQCDFTRVNLYTCKNTLGDFKFLRAFESNSNRWNAGKKHAEIEFPYIFSKDKVYKMVLCDSSYCNITDFSIDYYDADHKLRVRIYDKISKKFSSQLVFNCKQTGVYYVYLRYECINPVKDCELIMLGYKQPF